MFAEKIISEDVKDEEIKEILLRKEKMLDVMGVLQHHDSITGTEKQAVADDYAAEAFAQQKYSDEMYHKLLSEKLYQNTKINATDIRQCIGSSNDTVLDCPQKDSPEDFILLAHNQHPT